MPLTAGDVFSVIDDTKVDKETDNDESFLESSNEVEGLDLAGPNDSRNSRRRFQAPTTTIERVFDSLHKVREAVVTELGSTKTSPSINSSPDERRRKRLPAIDLSSRRESLSEKPTNKS